jgi:hypothetical protein
MLRASAEIAKVANSQMREGETRRHEKAQHGDDERLFACF